MNRKKKTKENERLEKLKGTRRKKYAEIKEDPELYALEKEKEKRRYQERKRKKQIKSVHEESPRDQREKRKKWREASKKYRQNKKEMLKTNTAPEVVLINAVNNDKDQNETDDPLVISESPVCPDLKIRKIRYQEQKKRRYLLSIIKQLRDENKTIKKQLHQLQKERMDKKKDKGILAKIRKSAIVKKKKKEGTRLQKLVKKVREFYLDDSNSTIGAGKKEYITKLKIQKQKRYMTNTQKNLHEKFMKKNQVKVSYTFFCKHRPFWVLTPKSSQRDTCKCLIHENIELTIQALKTASIIDEANSTELIKNLCCSIYETKCLERKCESCNNKVVKFNEFNNDHNITYYRWVRARERSQTKKGPKIITITKKEEVVAKPIEIVKALEANLLPFFEHCYKIHNQYTHMKQLKDSLSVNCAVIHADFSENYGLKYNQEVQSMHFGGSRQEVSLHTAVIYNFDFGMSSIKPTSVCTTSSCLRHDASAVWAHITPLIQRAINDNPFIDTLHFQTDSPTSQYRNKYIFYMISQLHKDFPSINAITWNYSEAGHGKGAPDGVGGTLKRTVDSCVNHGVDVGSYDKFMRVIKENVENVITIDVPEAVIKEKDKKFPIKVPPFKGTLAVHQVLWKKGTLNLTFRKASCFECGCGTICLHGKHLGFLQLPKAYLIPSIFDKPLIASKSHGNEVLSNITNTPKASTSSVETNVNVAGPSNIRILSNKLIIVKKTDILQKKLNYLLP